MDAKHYKSLSDIFGSLHIDHGAQDSPQCRCITAYLNEVGCKSYVLEENYVDAGYLADFVGYYAMCHDMPPKHTRRLHFFTQPAEKVDALWRQVLNAPEKVEEVQKSLDETYLGFVVLKPLRSTVIGKTCLRTYPEIDEESHRARVFPIRRHYVASLWGMKLNVNTVAFQEQDREIAACATAAIWSAMHAMPPWFTVHEIPSPFQITSSGWDGKIQPMDGETASRFPSNGMDVKQIVGCLRQHGIETSVLGVGVDDGCQKLLENVAAFLVAKTPILLVGSLYARREGEAKHTLRGLHAATILGYANSEEFMPGAWPARIQRLYIHDDTLGPFASFEPMRCDAGRFRQALGHTDAEDGPPGVVDKVTGYLRNTGGTFQGVGLSGFIVPRYIIIPINQKLHLPYPTVRDFVELLMTWFKTGGPKMYGKGATIPELSWTIRLRDQPSFKAMLLQASWWISVKEKEAALRRSMSRLLWTIEVSTLTVDGEQLVALLELDATSLQQTGAVREVHVGKHGRDVAATVLSRWLSDSAHYANSRRGVNQVDRVDGNLEACILSLRESLKKML